MIKSQFYLNDIPYAAYPRTKYDLSSHRPIASWGYDLVLILNKLMYRSKHEK